MASALEWYILGIVLLFVGFLSAAVYYDEKFSGYTEQRWNTPIEWQIAAGFIGIGIVGVLGIYGTIPGTVGSQRQMAEMTIHGGPLVAGCVGLAIAASNGRTFVRLRRADDGKTGSVTAESAGKTVAITGVVTDNDPGTSPALSRPAVCWSWRFYTRGMFGQGENPEWMAQQAGSGGVPFQLDDGSGPVRVDPTAARADLSGGQTEVYDADDEQPGRVGRNLPPSTAGEEYKYEEAVATDGRELVVLGTVTDDRTIDADRVFTTGFIGGERRYVDYAALFGISSIVAITLGFYLTTSYFETLLPF